MGYSYERQVDFFRAENDKKLDEGEWRLVEHGITSFSAMKKSTVFRLWLRM